MFMSLSALTLLPYTVEMSNPEKPPFSMSDHVFICYAREDQEFVFKLAANLKGRGVPAWLDQWDVLPGADWDQTIDSALYDCAQFLIVLSSAAVISKEVRGELRTALNANKPIIPVLHRECQIPRQLQVIQHVDFTSCGPDDEDTLNRLVRVLRVSESAPLESKKESSIEAREEAERPKQNLLEHGTRARAAKKETERGAREKAVQEQAVRQIPGLSSWFTQARFRARWETVIEPGKHIPEGIKLPLTLLFMLFLVINGLFGFLRPITTIFGLSDPVVMGLLDVPFGSRLLVFLAGAGVSWGGSRFLYWFLFTKEVEVDDAVNIAYTFFFYLLLTITTFSFLGVLGWYWFPPLFLILFIVSLLTLWNFLGGLMTAGSFVVAALVVMAVWFWSHSA